MRKIIGKIFQYIPCRFFITYRHPSAAITKTIVLSFYTRWYKNLNDYWWRWRFFVLCVGDWWPFFCVLFLLWGCRFFGTLHSGLWYCEIVVLLVSSSFCFWCCEIVVCVGCALRSVVAADMLRFLYSLRSVFADPCDFCWTFRSDCFCYREIVDFTVIFVLLWWEFCCSVFAVARCGFCCTVYSFFADVRL